MIVFLNGKFVTEEKAVVSVFDRGFLFGDGVWEALLVKNGRPFAWDEHLQRLAAGIAFLKLTPPFPTARLRDFAMELIERNCMPDCMLRLSISRGITARGYSPKGAVRPATVMTLHPLAAEHGEKTPRWRVNYCEHSGSGQRSVNALQNRKQAAAGARPRSSRRLRSSGGASAQHQRFYRRRNVEQCFLGRTRRRLHDTASSGRAPGCDAPGGPQFLRQDEHQMP